MTDEMAGYLLQSYLEHKVPGAADIWPAVRARLSERQHSPGHAVGARRAAPWSRRAAPRLLPWTAVALVAALALGITASPTVKAGLLAVVQRYWFAVAPAPGGPSGMAGGAGPDTSGAALNGGASSVALGSVADAEKTLGFVLPQPRYLPSGFGLRGVDVDTGAAMLLYRPSSGDTNLMLRVTRTAPEGGDEVADADIESILVGGHPALFTEETNMPAETTSRSVTWEADGYTFLLSSFGLVSRDELLRVANSVSAP